MGRSSTDRIGPDDPTRSWGPSERGEGIGASPHVIDGLDRAKRRVVVCHDQAENEATTGTKV